MPFRVWVWARALTLAFQVSALCDHSPFQTQSDCTGRTSLPRSELGPGLLPVAELTISREERLLLCLCPFRP